MSIKFTCKILKLNRSSYYKWLKRSESKQDIENIEIYKFIKQKQEEYKYIFGYRIMCAMVNREFCANYNPKRIYRIMKISNLQAKIRKSSKPKYIRSTPEVVAQNIMNRDFSTNLPNEKWCCDVTEFKISSTGLKLYLAAIIDLFDNTIVGYQISERNDNILVFDAYREAINNNPNSKAMFHSDRGYQFTSKAFKRMLEDQNMVQSMSRVGRCIDNGPIEKFWAILKTEMVDYNKANSISELKDYIIEHIYFYNNIRLQPRFNYKTPIEVRNEALDQIKNNLVVVTYPIVPNPKVVKYWENIDRKNNITQTTCV
ncbi:IS3 family transposase [Mycoplasma sp. P36-A1]|uniref:IS3 family transposase n=1 Tax=Mycoplasma sp. P36-A1 TaxID=3252900 RepID=UPI003C2DF8E6